MLTDFVGSNLVETPQEIEARTTWFITQRIPHWVWITGYVVFAVLAIGLVPQVGDTHCIFAELPTHTVSGLPRLTAVLLHQMQRCLQLHE